MYRYLAILLTMTLVADLCPAGNTLRQIAVKGSPSAITLPEDTSTPDGMTVASDGKIRADAFYFFGAIVIFLTFHEFWNLKPFICTYCKKSCHMEHNGWGPTLRRVVGLDRVYWLCSRNYRCRNCYNEELVSSYFCSFYQNCFFTISFQF